MGAPMLGFIFLPLLLVVLCWGQRWEGETVAGAEEGAGVSWGPEVWGPKESVPLTFWHPFSLCFYEKDAAELSSLMPSLPSSPVRFPPLLMWNRSLFYIIIHSVFSLGGLIHSELDPPPISVLGAAPSLTSKFTSLASYISPACRSLRSPETSRTRLSIFLSKHASSPLLLIFHYGFTSQVACHL